MFGLFTVFLIKQIWGNPGIGCLSLGFAPYKIASKSDAARSPHYKISLIDKKITDWENELLIPKLQYAISFAGAIAPINNIQLEKQTVL